MERRSYTRYQVDWPVRIKSARRDLGVGRIRDVSLGGALIECSLPFQKDENLELEIFPRYRAREQRIEARVRAAHHRKLASGTTILGVEFILMPDLHRKLLLNIISVQSGCQPIFPDDELDLV